MIWADLLGEHIEAKVLLWSVIAYNIRVMTGHIVKLV
jgi:hypothetical protein